VKEVLKLIKSRSKKVKIKRNGVALRRKKITKAQKRKKVSNIQKKVGILKVIEMLIKVVPRDTRQVGVKTENEIKVETEDQEKIRTLKRVRMVDQEEVEKKGVKVIIKKESVALIEKIVKNIEVQEKTNIKKKRKMKMI
jgi:hypothetical protein